MSHIKAPHYLDLQRTLLEQPKRWLVTGVAGFIGSNILETLLELNQTVVGIDNFSTGRQANLLDVQNSVTPEQWLGFSFAEGDITDIELCRKLSAGADYVLHQAALGSVPRSIENPLATHQANVNGTLNVLLAAREAGVKRFVYASSSSVYGDNASLPKREELVGRQLSPYAVSKYACELYADVFSSVYGIEAIGLRYFNVFGPRQSPDGPYAAVIPRWIHAVLRNKPCVIYGDGTTSRDFCFVSNAVQANILAATSVLDSRKHEVLNIAVGDKTSLVDLHGLIQESFSRHRPDDDLEPPVPPEFAPARVGDIRHSQADTEKATRLIGYSPTHTIRDGIDLTVEWHMALPEES